MENFCREATRETPHILFDAEQHELTIQGVSYPEDYIEFFQPIFAWLKEYFAQLNHADVTVNIKIVYFHSGSTKILLYFFDKLAEEAGTGTHIVINWFYNPEEHDMLEFGEQFQQDFNELNFNFVVNSTLPCGNRSGDAA